RFSASAVWAALPFCTIFSASSRKAVSGCTCAIRPERYAALLILRTASSNGTRVFWMVRAPFTSVTLAREASAFERWSLTIFSKTAASGLDAQMGACVMVWAAARAAAKVKAESARRRRKVDTLNLMNEVGEREPKAIDDCQRVW